MSTFFPSIAGLVITAAALGGCAQTATQHAQHHPASATSAAACHAMSPEKMAAMEKHMQAMHAMHEKMAVAKTPEERQALMAEHMKGMQCEMPMMKMGAMPGDKGMAGDKSMPGHGMGNGMGQGMDQSPMMKKCMAMCMGK